MYPLSALQPLYDIWTNNGFAFIRCTAAYRWRTFSLFWRKKWLEKRCVRIGFVDNSADKSYSIKLVVVRYVHCTCILFPPFYRSLGGEPFLFWTIIWVENTGWETLLITTLQINPTQSSWLSDIWTMYMYPLSFFSTKALMENLFFAGQRDEWKRHRSSADNSADKSPSIKLVVRYI